MSERVLDLDLPQAFIVFDAQDSGCASFGIDGGKPESRLTLASRRWRGWSLPTRHDDAESIHYQRLAARCLVPAVIHGIVID